MVILLSLAASVSSSLASYPHGLAYFNEAAGGPENGWRHMLGSSFDWGQDLYFRAGGVMENAPTSLRTSRTDIYNPSTTFPGLGSRLLMVYVAV